jgi:hypothetical protein
MSAREKSRLLAIGLILLSVTIAGVSAATISLSKNGSTVEYGQGTYEIKACNSYMKINLVEGATGTFGAPEGLTPLTGFTISGLNVSKCPDSQISLQILDEAGIPLPVYRRDGNPLLCAPQQCNTSDSHLSYAATLSITSGSSLSVAESPTFASVSAIQPSGSYLLSFVQPAILARDMGRILVESSK